MIGADHDFALGKTRSIYVVVHYFKKGSPVMRKVLSSIPICKTFASILVICSVTLHDVFVDANLCSLVSILPRVMEGKVGNIPQTKVFLLFGSFFLQWLQIFIY